VSTIILDTSDFPNLEGQQVGRELELEITAVVTRVEATLIGVTSDPNRRVTLPGSITVELLPVRVDITQTT
jgi:hypothetical protein